MTLLSNKVDISLQELNSLPTNWKVKRFKFVATINPVKQEFSQKQLDHYAIFLPMEKVSENGEIDQSLKKKTKELLNGYTYFERGDILIAKITPCFENGKGTYLEKLETNYGFGSTEFHVIRCKAEILPKFVYYLTKSNFFMRSGEASMTGSAGQKRVPTEFLNEFLTPYPPVSHQHIIIEFLNRKTALIDETIRKKERLIELLQEERTAIINQAVTRGLDPNVPMKDSGVEWLGMIPKHWITKRLRYSVHRSTKKASIKTNFVVALENILCGSGQYIESEGIDLSGDLLEFEQDDILFCKLRPYLTKVLWAKDRGSCVSELLVLKGKDLIPGFLYFRVLSSAFIKEVNSSTYGSKMPRASWEDFISQMRIGIPPSREQAQIVEYLKEMNSDMEATLNKVKKEISLLNEYRTALINEVVTGKRCVIPQEEEILT